MIRKFLIALCALLAFVSSANAVKVVFRLDDPSAQYDSIHCQVLKLFIEKEVPLSIAMVPCMKNESAYEVTDSTYWTYLCAPNIEIALHGLTHENINGQGEFGALSPDETNRRFQKGKEILKKHFDKPINTFIPPFNATNSSFPQNLEANGLSIISADIFQTIPCKGDIQYYPETLGHLMKEKGIWNAARESIDNCKLHSAVCVIMFHAYDLPDSTAWAQLESLLDYCKQNNKIELYTFSSLYASRESSNWLRYRTNQLSSGLSKLVLPKGVLLPTWLCLFVHIANALFYMLLAVIGGLIVLFCSHSKTEKRYLNAITIFVGVIVFCFAWFHLFSPMKLLLIACLVNTLPPIYAFIRSKIEKN